MDHASAGDLLDRYKHAWETFDGDAWTDLFTEDAEYHEDPFEPPLVGSNALRAYLLEAAQRQDQVEMTVERHWAAGDTVLAAWHASYIQVADSRESPPRRLHDTRRRRGRPDPPLSRVVAPA